MTIAEPETTTTQGSLSLTLPRGAGAPPPAEPLAQLGTAGHVVLAAGRDEIALAGRLLRPAPAVIALPLPEPWSVARRDRAGLLERALATARRAGFRPQSAAELTSADVATALAAMSAAARDDATVIVIATRSAREARDALRAAGAPVLALPPAARRVGGPVIVRAGDGGSAAATIPGLLARDAALIVASYAARCHHCDGDTPPNRRNGAARAADDAAALLAEHGMSTSVVLSADADVLHRLAVAKDGVPLLADDGEWRTGRVLDALLRTRRPCLLLPDRHAEPAS